MLRLKILFVLEFEIDCDCQWQMANGKARNQENNSVIG